MNDNFQQGVAALKAGDRASARRLLSAVVRESPENHQAWLWLSGAVDRDEERIYCLRQVLQLDPDNQLAARGLAQTLERWTHPTAETGLHGLSAIPGSEQSGSFSELDVAVPESDPSTESRLIEVTQPATRPVEHQAAWPNLRFMVQPGAEISGSQVFKVRPSLAQVLMAFWLMFLIVWGMNGLLQESIELELSISFLTCTILGLVVAALLATLSRTRYELTTRQLTVTAGGERTIIPLRHILHVSPRQNWLQKKTNTGDILVEASVSGLLRQIRLKNISEFKTRLEQLQYLVHQQE